MRKPLLLTTGLAWLALTGAASAAVTVTLKEGPADPQYFAPLAAGQNNFTLGDITWTLQREHVRRLCPSFGNGHWTRRHNVYVR
jgi:hypothetical protein